MKKAIILLLTIASYVISFADQRGVSFEKDGLIYTIASEYIIKKDSVGRKSGEPRYYFKNRGEVYVSGVTASDEVVRIPTSVSFPTSFCRKTEDNAIYSVLGIGEKAFEGARLKDLIIPYGLKFIGDEAFSNMEITSGVFALPPARRMGKNLFIGMKTKVFLTELEDYIGSRPIQIYYDKTFEDTESLPEIYIPHSSLSTQLETVDKRIFYTIGENIIKDWMSTKEKVDKNKRPWSIASSSEPCYFWTLDNNSSAPKITIRARKRFEKTNKDIDRLPPYEFVCWNTYTQKKDVYQEFVLNNSIYRGRKGNEYFYFTSDGKPITNKESLLDDNGQDPFGLQVISAEELKARKEAREREKNLNKKLKDLKSIFGF